VVTPFFLPKAVLPQALDFRSRPSTSHRQAELAERWGAVTWGTLEMLEIVLKGYLVNPKIHDS